MLQTKDLGQRESCDWERGFTGASAASPILILVISCLGLNFQLSVGEETIHFIWVDSNDYFFIYLFFISGTYSEVLFYFFSGHRGPLFRFYFFWLISCFKFDSMLKFNKNNCVLTPSLGLHCSAG